jgi:hypothetical protein
MMGRWDEDSSRVGNNANYFYGVKVGIMIIVE